MREIVGADHVYTRSQELDELAQATIPFPKRPAAVVCPASQEEVQRIVRVAGQYRLPLFPCSTGRNWGLSSKTPFSTG